MLNYIDQYPAISPILKKIKAGIDDGKFTKKADVYAEWKRLKAMGFFEQARADLIKAGDALMKKGDEAAANKQYALANAIVKPGFIDNLYNVPGSLRAPVKTVKEITEINFESYDPN